MWYAWAQVVLSICASAQYAYNRDWLHSVYWVLAAGIVITINLMK